MAAIRRIRRLDQLFRRQMRKERAFRKRVDCFRIYSEYEIFERFRFTQDGIDFIFDLLEDDLRSPTLRSNAVAPSIKILLAIRFLGSGSCQLLIGDSHGVSQPSSSRFIWEVVAKLVDLAPRFICYPTTEEHKRYIMKGFYAIAGFPGVTGVIDCTHVRIAAPYENEDSYVNRKGYHSMNIQCICDHNYKFTSVLAHWPGENMTWLFLMRVTCTQLTQMAK